MFFLRNNLPEIKDGVYVIKIDKYKLTGAHRVALYLNGDNVTYFGVKYIPQEIKKFTGNENITLNIYRVQGYNSIMRG